MTKEEAKKEFFCLNTKRMEKQCDSQCTNCAVEVIRKLTQ